jgi:hypothetical protein
MASVPEVAHDGRIVGPQVCLRIGVHTLRLWSPDPGVEFFVHRSHEPFIAGTGVDVDCDVRWEIGEVRTADTEILRTSGDRWQLRRTPEGWDEFAFRGVSGVPEVCIRVSPDMRQATIVRSPRSTDDRVVFASEHPWSEFLISRLVVRDGGLLLHASSTVMDGGAILFVGHSGAGKSTIGEIAERCGGTTLSDDRTIVMMRGKVPVASGTPWHGSYAQTSASSAPVSGIFLLVKDVDDHVDDVPQHRALKELFVRLIHPRVTEGELSNSLAALGALLAARPLRTLYFRPTSAAVELARRVARLEPAT